MKRLGLLVALLGVMVVSLTLFSGRSEAQQFGISFSLSQQGKANLVGNCYVAEAVTNNISYSGPTSGGFVGTMVVKGTFTQKVGSAAICATWSFDGNWTIIDAQGNSIQGVFSEQGSPPVLNCGTSGCVGLETFRLSIPTLRFNIGFGSGQFQGAAGVANCSAQMIVEYAGVTPSAPGRFTGNCGFGGLPAASSGGFADVPGPGLTFTSWNGADGIRVEEAIQNASIDIDAVWVFDNVSQQFRGYFPKLPGFARGGGFSLRRGQPAILIRQ